MDLEAVDPLQVAIAGHLGHVMPRGVAREREEVETLAGDVNRTLQGALCIADRVMVMEIAHRLIGRPSSAAAGIANDVGRAACSNDAARKLPMKARRLTSNPGMATSISV